MPPRIALTIQRYLPLLGGMERQTHAQALRLVRLGFDVHIITRRHAGLPAFERMDGVAVHRVPIFGPKATASLSYTFHALRVLRCLQPDILHAHELLSAATIGLLAKRLWGWPLLFTPHRGGIIGDVQRLHQKFLGAQRMAAIAAQGERFICISREIADELQAAGVPPERLVHIPNGVNIARFHPRPPEERAALRRHLGISEESLMTVFSGRLAAEKRVNFLVEVWPRVRRAHPRANLHILGEGDQQERLESITGEGVFFHGYVQNVEEYLAAADLFVLPSIAEGISGAMLEAMSSGLPVLLTRVGAAPEVVAHGETGWLIPPDDRDALEAALLHLLNDGALRARLGEAARRRVETAYALDVVVEELADVYREILAGGRR